MPLAPPGLSEPQPYYTVVREQKRTRAISVGERPSAQSSTMCILSLLLGRRSRFIFWMRFLRSSEARVILCIWAAVSFVAGWIWRLYHATGDGRLFNYPVHLSRTLIRTCTLSGPNKHASKTSYTRRLPRRISERSYLCSF